MQSAFIITLSGRASVSRTVVASTPSFGAAAARSFHLSPVGREGESLASIADAVEAGPRSLTAADRAAGKERSGSLITSKNPLEFQIPRCDKVFSPNDFTMQKRTWRNKWSVIPRTSGPKKVLAIREDVFHQLHINPLDEIYNRTLLRDYVSEMGRIIPRDQTKLTWKNQRKLGQAIRRAKAMGIIPIFSKGHGGGSAAAKQNRVMTSSADVQNLRKAANEVDANSIPDDSILL